MSILKTASLSLAIVGMGLSSSAYADVRAGDIAPRASVVSKASSAPKVSRRTDGVAAGSYASADGAGSAALLLLGGGLIGAGICAAAHCSGHTSP